MVSVICDGEECIYHAGEFYYIQPDIPHAVELVNDTAYSMVSVCISVGKMPVEAGNEVSCVMKLKQMIIETPEKEFLIEDMAKQIGISPYHMIRQFRKVYLLW